MFIDGFKKWKNKSNINLEESLIKLQDEYYKLCSDNLRAIFKPFVDKPKTRVSIYKFEDDYFKLIGRYSKTTKYNVKGRSKYKSDEGFIAIGWENGSHIEKELPLYERDGKEKYYEEVKNRCNIQNRTINKMKMKSSSFYIKTIENAYDSRSHLGIIVFEQIDPQKIDSEMLDKLIDENIEILTTIFKSMKTLHLLN